MKKSMDTAKAVPTKQFFVSMLTRDIKLEDAILDLIDNCLDGALRLADGDDVDYEKHRIAIQLSSSKFSIEDDCGGIPRDVAINYAFKMGRDPDDERAEGHQHQRQNGRLATAVTVIIGAKKQPAERAQEKTDAVGGEGEQQLRCRIAGRKKHLADDGGKKAENQKIVKFQRIADSAGGNQARRARLLRLSGSSWIFTHSDSNPSESGVWRAS